jgi:ABC-type nitrate/sulfonate/bicarbonate transport system substrate-binding protein
VAHRSPILAAVRRPLIALLLASALAGCSPVAEDRPNRQATLVLDSAPGAVHAGIYLALARDFDDAEGVQLRVSGPSPRAARLLLDGRATFAILTLRNLLRARARGSDVVGVMALVQQPLRVLATARTTLRDDRATVRATVAALRRGYREALLDPESAVSALVDAHPRLDRARLQRELGDIEPRLTGAGGFGVFDPAVVRSEPAALDPTLARP